MEEQDLSKVTPLNESLSFWVPQFPHLSNGDNTIGTYLIGWLGLLKFIETVTDTLLSANLRFLAIMIM